MRSKTAVFLALILSAGPFLSAANAPAGGTASIAIFIPGTLQGSPTYEALDAGVRKAVGEFSSVTVKTIEGGFNQAQWGEQIGALSAGGDYTYIVTSNPAMPEICAKIAQFYPKQKFIILEAWSDNPAIASLAYNHKELGYLHGVLAALLTLEKKAKPSLGLIVGQEYPEMNNSIRPGVEEGFKSIIPDGKVEFRVIGNWYDAGKGEELAKSLFSQGTEVILPIGGSANQGVVTAAKQAKKAILWYDSNAYGLEKGVIVGSGWIKQDQASYELVRAALSGTLVYGKPRLVGIQEGYVDYFTMVPEWKTLLSADVRAKFEKVLAEFKSGKRQLK